MSQQAYNAGYHGGDAYYQQMAGAGTSSSSSYPAGYPSSGYSQPSGYSQSGATGDYNAYAPLDAHSSSDHNHTHGQHPMHAPQPSYPATSGEHEYDPTRGGAVAYGREQEQRQEYLRDSSHPSASGSSTTGVHRSASTSSQRSGTITPGGSGQRAYPAYAHYSIQAYPPQRSASAASNSSKAGLALDERRRRGSEPDTAQPGHKEQGSGSSEFGPDYPEGWTQEDMEAEKEFLKGGLFNWKDLSDWRFWIRAKWWYWYVALIIIIVLVVLMTIYHDQIVEWCEPAANWMKDLPGGWAIPIGILFVISFPPLFGHEIVAIICGLVWGLWIGFGIVCAGTFLGEIGNFYAFKYCCRSRAEKYERKNMAYACLAYTMREGSLWIIIAARLSAIPGHLTTAIFSTCGMSIWVFILGAFLTLPKQLITVYLGVIFKGGSQSKTNKIISYTVLAVGFLITIAAAWWIWYEMHKVRVHVWRKRRMEMASRGISLNELSYNNSSQLDLDVEAGRPMLPSNSDSAHAGHDDALQPPRHLHGAQFYSPNGTHEYNPAPPHTHDSLRVLGEQDRQRASYLTPYDISYKKTNDDMSVYGVDAMSERMNLEADIAERLQDARSHTASAPHSSLHAQQMQTQGDNTVYFPTAQASGLRRDPSAASAFYRPGEERPQVIPSSFPSASPFYAREGQI